MPILPGVVLLDETLRALEQEAGLRHGQWHIGTAKFLKLVHPGEQLQVQHERLASGAIRFSIVSEGVLVASGTLSRVPEVQPGVPRPAVPEPRARAAPWADIPERGSATIVSAGVFIATRLGRDVARGAMPLVIAYFVAFDGPARRASRAFLQRTLGRRPRLRDTYRHLHAFGSTLLDRLYLLHGRDDLFELTTEGEELMRDTHARGAGAFLLGAHLGSFEMLSTVGRRNPGLRVAMAMYDDQAGRLAAVFRDSGKSAPTDIITLGRVDSMLKIHACLDEGKFVGMLADRTIGEAPAQRVNFLGTPTLFPSGPMRLAAALRRPVIFMAALYRGGNRYHAVFRQIADFSQVARGERETAVREAIQRFAAMLEHYCRSDPHNWFNFYDFWHDAPAPSPAAAG